jgi:hypothetical protein
MRVRSTSASCSPRTWVSCPLHRQSLGWNRRGHGSGPLSATWHADCSTISWFYGNCFSWAAWSCASSCQAEVVVSARRTSSALRRRSPSVIERDISRRSIGRRGLTVWPPRSPDLTPAEFFLWGHLKKHVYAVPLRTIEDRGARLHAAVTMVNVNNGRRVRENAVRHTVICFGVRTVHGRPAFTSCLTNATAIFKTHWRLNGVDENDVVCIPV